jgi:peptide-methionine (R)-S-oxide reductase
MSTTAKSEPRPARVEKSEQQWKSELTPEQYAVCRQQGTEPAFTGCYWNSKQPGTYHCACCGLALFPSDTKYDSGTGWPSFHTPSAQTHVKLKRDASHGMERTEVVCAACDAHLGHVFNDGPPPSGLRYCMNSVSLRLEPAKP